MTEYHWLALMVASAAWTWYLCRWRDHSVTVAVEMCKRLVDTQNAIIDADRQQLAAAQSEITRLASALKSRPVRLVAQQQVPQMAAPSKPTGNGRLSQTADPSTIEN